MAELLHEDEGAWLHDSLRDLLDFAGSAPFLERPIIEPTDAFFPDKWEASHDGVLRLARRLLALAELPLDADVTLYAELDQFGQTCSTHNSSTAAWFAGIEGRTCRFGANLAHLASPEGIVGAMAHEVTHAWRTHQQVADRSSPEEEHLTDLTTVYLGFGILTANASYRFRKSGEMQGNYAVTRWEHSRLGYLSPAAMCFLLGTQARARRLTGSQRRRIEGFLEPNQAAYFGAAFAEIRNETADVFAQARAAASAEGAPKSRPFPELESESGPQAAAAPEPEPEPEYAGELDELERSPVVFRVIGGRRIVAPLLLGAVLGFVLIGPLLMVDLGVMGGPPAWLLLAFPAVGAVAMVARQKREPDACSDPDCSAALDAIATTCPGCSRPIAWAIASASDRLDAEERHAKGPRTT